MRREALLGVALGGLCDGDLVHLGDLAGLVTRRAALAPLVGMYLPPTEVDGHGVLALDRLVIGATARYMRALALAHLFLGHAQFDAYMYSRHGALYGSPAEESSARALASTLLGRVGPAHDTGGSRLN